MMIDGPKKDKASEDSDEAVEEAKQEEIDNAHEDEEALDEGLEDSMDASDPPSSTIP